MSYHLERLVCEWFRRDKLSRAPDRLSQIPKSKEPYIEIMDLESEGIMHTLKKEKGLNNNGTL